MSELAFDGNGDPITFPAEAEELRVRRFRNPGMRGACEVVHEANGAPLYVPVDTSYLEFRGLVEGVPGRYRLDPVDSGRRVIPNCVAAYVTLTEPVRNGGSFGSAEDRDSVIRELARANAEMTKTIADRFASVMAAAADLLRAADGAGMPRRESMGPLPIESVREAQDPNDDDDDDEDDDDQEDEEETSPDIVSLIAELLPTIQMWLAARAAEKTAAAQTAAAPAAEPVQSPMPAPHVDQADGDREAGAAAGRADGSPRPSGDVGPGVGGEGPAIHAARPEATSAAPDASVRNAEGAWSRGKIQQLRAIYQELSREERRIAQVVVARMPPDLRTRWLAELLGMTVEEAVGLVRSMIPGHRRRQEDDS